MTQDINMPATVRALSTASKVGKSDRQRRENEKRRKKRRKKGKTGEPIQDQIDIEAQAPGASPTKGREKKMTNSGPCTGSRRKKTKVDITI